MWPSGSARLGVVARLGPHAAASAQPPLSPLKTLNTLTNISLKPAETLDPAAFAPTDHQKVEGAHELHVEELRLRMVRLMCLPLPPLLAACRSWPAHDPTAFRPAAPAACHRPAFLPTPPAAGGGGGAGAAADG